MKAMIFEQWQGGHYFNYLEVLVPALATMATEVVVAVTRQASSSTQFREQLGHLFEIQNVRLHDDIPLPGTSNAVSFRFALARHVVDAVEQVRPDFLLLPSGDEQLLTLPILDILRGRHALRNVHVEVLLHYPAFTRTASWRSRIVSRLQRLLAERGAVDRFGFVNYLQHDAVTRLGDRWAGSSYVAGDPVDVPPELSSAAARRSLAIEESGIYLGMIGGLDSRKALPETLAAFRVASRGRKVRMLVAGRLASNYAGLIAADYQDLVSDGTLVVRDRFLSVAELRACFAAIDIQCQVYRTFEGLSSLLLKGVAAGARTIANDSGWSGAVVRKFDLGCTVIPQDTQAFASAMVASTDAEPAQLGPAVGKLLAFHSPANFSANVLESAARLAGTPSIEPMRWPDVVASL